MKMVMTILLCFLMIPLVSLVASAAAPVFQNVTQNKTFVYLGDLVQIQVNVTDDDTPSGDLVVNASYHLQGNSTWVFPGPGIGWLASLSRWVINFTIGITKEWLGEVEFNITANDAYGAYGEDLTSYYLYNVTVHDTMYWVGVTNGKWSSASNWAGASGGVGGVGVPNHLINVVFDSGGNNNSVIDYFFNGSVYSVNVTQGYGGVITQNKSLNVTKNFNLFNGTWQFSTNVSGNLIVDGDMFVNSTVYYQASNNAHVTGFNGTGRTFIIGGDLIVDNGGVLDGVGLGFNIGQGPGKGVGLTAGGGHGGRGGTYYIAGAYNGTGGIYGSVTSPTSLGSGGYSNSLSSRGGGSIIINVTGNTTINGSITSNGNISSYGSGGGGSVYITTGNIFGSGSILAGGGDNTAYYYGHGGGGRISVILTSGTSFGSVTFRAYGGHSTETESSGAAGTIYLKKSSETYGSLIVDNNGTSTSSSVLTIINSTEQFDLVNVTNFGKLEFGVGALLNLSHGGNITGDGGFDSRIIFGDGEILFSPDAFLEGTISKKGISRHTWTTNLVVKDGGILTHEPNFASEINKINLTVIGNLTVKSGGVINVSGRGYGVNYGPGRGVQYDGSGHGGMGGEYDAGNGGGGRTYGSITSPTSLGSGGHGSGVGGGAIILNVTDTINVTGAIEADGVAVTGNYGGPSGGSVYIITKNIIGDGEISADGGDAKSSYGKGGGGRIAIILTSGTGFGSLNITAFGFNSTQYPLTIGAAGTVYLKKSTDTYGQLIIDNNDRAPSSATTFINGTVKDRVVGDVHVRNSASLDLNDSLKIYGFFNNTATFKSDVLSTMIFDGDTSQNSSVYSSEKFNNLNITKKGGFVVFSAGFNNVTGSFVVQGNATDFAYLRSVTDGVQWSINVSGSDADYVNVMDSNNTGATIFTNTSKDSGNNFGWDFGLPYFTGMINGSDHFYQYENFTANFTVTDETALDWVWIESNHTGSFVNYSFIQTSEASIIFNSSFNISLPDGNQVSWRGFANDTLGNINNSVLQGFIVKSSDSCTAPASGHWLIEDNCYWTSNQVVPLTASIMGGHNCTLSANFTRTNKISPFFIEAGSRLFIQGGALA